MFLELLAILCVAIVVAIKWNFNYWNRKRFPYEKPNIPFGVLDSVRRGKRSLGMAIYDVYRRRPANEKVVGIYLFLRPALLVRDAELARDILSKDFASFHDRGVYVDEEHDPLSAGLFFLKGQKWKSLRQKLTPSFSSGKLKSMFGSVEGTANKMVAHLNATLPDEGYADVELKELFSIYAIDIIASEIFGLEVNSFEDPNNEFYAISEKVNQADWFSVMRATCQFLYPSLEKFFQRLGWTEAAPRLMRDLVRHTLQYREKHNIVRKDMLQMLMQLRNTGKISENDDWSAEKNADGMKSMSIEMITAQLMLFYAAGYETSASAAAFTLFELAQYPEVLEKAQRDVLQTVEKHGQLSYEAVQDMQYIGLCVTETLRKYPGLPILNRECTEDYTIPGSDLVVEAGTPIVISLFGIHRDAEYFPDPDRYDPERFAEEKRDYNSAAFMPFGGGPRHCIAQRMGQVNVRVALAKILLNFNIEINKERREIEIATNGVPIMPKGGVIVRLSKKNCK